MIDFGKFSTEYKQSSDDNSEAEEAMEVDNKAENDESFEYDNDSDKVEEG